MPKMFFAHENMKKPASKVAEPAQIQPKSQFLFHKNLPPRDFSLMTLYVVLVSLIFTNKTSMANNWMSFSSSNSALVKNICVRYLGC